MKIFAILLVGVGCVVSVKDPAVPALADGARPMPGATSLAAAILTPAAPPEPRINGPTIYGARPGSPFLYRIPCTGQRHIVFTAYGLPDGLTLDRETGIITGRVPQRGTYRITLVAQSTRGEARRSFRIVVSERLALTPPMGWNRWYIRYHRVSDRLMRQAAEQMIVSGMADYGYQYVNIDDCWMMRVAAGSKPRDAGGQILPNRNFPNMRSLTDFIHAKGLKAGIYTSPGPQTCAGYEGSYGHESQDAATFADWGFDFIKYDWCSYGQVSEGKSLESLKKPYQQMWARLQPLGRDIVFNLCQYGMGNVWEWGHEVGHCWRTTGDLGLEAGGRLPGFYSVGMSNARHWKNAHPGVWNDPDYLLLGWVGDARRLGVGRPTSLTPDEQYSYMSMWCLMAAPLIFSGDMARLDAFTLNVLCNHEVIDVDQDARGQQARILRQTDREFVLVKDLEDGSKAVGLFNLGSEPAKIAVAWRDLQVSGKQQVRDLWRQKDLGMCTERYETTVARHGVALFRLWPVPAKGSETD